MFSEKNIVVTIGNYGAVVALHEGKEIKNKIFLDDLSDESKIELKKIFIGHKSASVYLLLDTIDQSYKKKIYPSVSRADLNHIIKRDLATDGDKESIKNYIVLNKKNPLEKSSSHRWECLFVSSSNSEVINKWIEFLLEMPNRLIGIYMLPIEAFNMLQLMQKNKKAGEKKSKIKVKKPALAQNKLRCIIIQNKVSGIRQIAFSDQGIVFTRVVNYNFEQPDFLEKYEQDIYSTYEYLKRLFPTLAINELEITNVLPQEALNTLKKLGNNELNLTNYTPFEVAAQIGYGNLLSQNSNFSDLLISKVFSQGKKYLKFTIPRIKTLEKFFLTLRFSYYLNLILIILICTGSVMTVFTTDDVAEAINAVETQKFAATQELARVKSLVLNKNKDNTTDKEEVVSVERITDLGKIDEVLGNVGVNFVDSYTKLKFLKNFNVTLKSFSYSLEGFNDKNPTKASNYKIIFSGELANKNGDIESLFQGFDNLVSEIKKDLPENQIKYNEIPKTIDFNQKYLTYPVDFTLSPGSSIGAKSKK